MPAMNLAGPALNPGAGAGPRRGVGRSPGHSWTSALAGLTSEVMRCLPLASGAPSGAAFPRRSSLAPQSRRRRAPPARSCRLLLGELPEHDLPVGLVRGHQLVIGAGCPDAAR